MKKTILKTLVYFLFFIFSLLALLPKENLYYYFEKQLSSYNIVFSQEKVKESLFGLSILNNKIYSNGIYIANINATKFYSNLFYTKIKIDKVKIDDSFKAFIPLNFSQIYFTHSIVDPLNGHIKANSDIGDIKGVYEINKNLITFILTPNKNMNNNYKNMLSRFKTSDGKYKYEYKF